MVWLDILIAIVDKFLSKVIRQFIPLVKVQPKQLKVIKSDWMSESSFFIYSQSDQVLFNVYILVKIGDAKTEDFDLSKTDSLKDLKFLIKNTEINYEILRFNLAYENNKEFIILKIEQIDPRSATAFKIVANVNSDIKFRILKYSKKQSAVLHQPQAGAVSFEIPLKKKGQFQLKSISMLMKKNN